MSVAIRLVVASRNVLFRQCMAAALDRRRRFQVIAQVPDLAVAVIQVQAVEPDIAVIHLDSPATSAELDLVRGLSSSGCGVLVVSTGQAGEVSQLLQAGARGYLDYTRELPDLERAIDHIHSDGGVIVATSPVPDFPQGHRMPSRHDVVVPRPNVTERELDVLRLVALGRTNGEIARELCIAEHTAKGHLAKILGKLGLENRVQLAIYATQQGLVEATQPPTAPAVHRVPVEPPT